MNKDSLSGVAHTFATINFLYFCIYLFLVCIGIMVVVSLVTPPPAPVKLAGLTYSTTSAEDREETRASWGAWEVVHSFVVVAVVIAALLYFTG